MFIFGAIVGSFLNVVIYRFHTGKSLNGRSHCMSCGTTLHWYELFPIFSYLRLGGKCRSCNSYIPSRYLVVELITASVFVLLYFFLKSTPLLFFCNSILFSILIVIVVYDMRHMIIPDELSMSVGVVALVLLTLSVVTQNDWSTVLPSIMAGLGAATFFWSLWFVSKGRWVGLGDAKLALPLGMIVGLSGVYSMVIFSFWIGAAVSVTLLATERILEKGKTHLHFLATPLTIKSEVPFAPFLIAGFALVHIFHADIFKITYELFFTW